MASQVPETMAKRLPLISDGRPVPMFPAATAAADIGASKKLTSSMAGHFRWRGEERRKTSLKAVSSLVGKFRRCARLDAATPFFLRVDKRNEIQRAAGRPSFVRQAGVTDFIFAPSLRYCSTVAIDCALRDFARNLVQAIFLVTSIRGIPSVHRSCRHIHWALCRPSGGGMR